jgi:hypothetical protein
VPFTTAEIRHFGHPLHFVGLQLLHRREDRHHGVVDPDVDRTELALDPIGRALDRVRVRDVERQHERASARNFDVSFRTLESVDAARDQSDVSAVMREGADDRASDTRRRACHDNDPVGHLPAFEVGDLVAEERQRDAAAVRLAACQRLGHV